MNWRRHIAEDVVTKLLPVLTAKNFKQMKKPINIDIRFEKILDGIQGFVYQEDKHSYVIVMNRGMNKIELITNIAHELVHICQEECGYKFDYESNYWDQWQEVEAYAMQDDLANKYLELTSK